MLSGTASATGRSLAGGVLPSVVCLSVVEELPRGSLGPLGSSSHEGKKSNQVSNRKETNHT